MDINEANELIIREAFRRLGPKAQLDPARLREQIAEVVREQGETIFAQLSEEACEQLRNEGLEIIERNERLKRISKAIEYGRSLVAKYRVETLGGLPQDEQMEFARLWMAATGGAKADEN